MVLRHSRRQARFRVAIKVKRCFSRYTQRLKTVFLAHARAEHDVARQLAEFLEFGCNLTCYVEDGLIGGEQDLISMAEEGLSADVLVLLLSPTSSPARWVRERWEPVLFDQARRGGVEVVTVLLQECSFPPLLRRRNFIDGTTNQLTTRRLLKRWFWQRERGLTLDGPAKENCSRIRDLLAARRCLVVLDAPGPEISAELTAGGRTSTAVTLDAVTILETPQTPVYARSLIAARRYAEAYELLYRLLDAVVEPDACARELTWICEHWDRVEEANVLRFNYGSLEGEQLALF